METLDLLLAAEREQLQTATSVHSIQVPSDPSSAGQSSPFLLVITVADQRRTQTLSSEGRTRNDDWMDPQSRFLLQLPSWAISPPRRQTQLRPPHQKVPPDQISVRIYNSNKLFINNYSLRIHCNNNKNRMRSIINPSIAIIYRRASTPPLCRLLPPLSPRLRIIYRPEWDYQQCQASTPPPPQRPLHPTSQLRPPLPPRIANRRIAEMRWLINYRSRLGDRSRFVSRRRGMILLLEEWRSMVEKRNGF